jgi:hypothetical protein
MGNAHSQMELFFCLCNYTPQSLRLIVRSWLDVPTFATMREHPVAEGGTVGEKRQVILLK